MIANYAIQLRDQNSRPQDDSTGRQRRAGGAGSTVSVTISIGVAERQVDHRSPDEVLKSADEALYSAKEPVVTASWFSGSIPGAGRFAWRRDRGD